MTIQRTFPATLRPYQRLAYQLVLISLEKGCTRLYIALPTGTGKSLILAALAAHASTHGRVLVLVHRQDLVVQLARTLKQAELDVGMLIKRDFRKPLSFKQGMRKSSFLGAWARGYSLPIDKFASL